MKKQTTSKITGILLYFLIPIFLFAQAPSSMNDLIGVNIRAKDGYPQGFKKFGLVREYHEWASDVGYDNNALTNCSFQSVFPIKLNPSADPSTLLNFDGFYESFSGKMSPCLKGVAPQMRGLQHYCDLVLEQKPVCLGSGQPGYGNNCDNQFASKLTAFNIDENADAGAPLEKVDFPRAINGYYDGIGLANIKSNTDYTGSFTIKRNAASEVYFVKVWLDRIKPNLDPTQAPSLEPDGHFYNQAYKRNNDGTLVLPLTTNDNYEAVTITGENNAMEHLLILQGSEFNNNDEYEVEFNFSTESLLDGLYRIRVTANVLNLSIPKSIGNSGYVPVLALSDLGATPELSVISTDANSYDWSRVEWVNGQLNQEFLGNASSITDLEAGKTYQVTVTNNAGVQGTVSFYYDPNVIPYTLNGEAILYPVFNNSNDLNSLHTYSWAKGSVLGLGYWWPVNPSSATGDIWDVGLLKCSGGIASYPTPEGLWGANDIETQITHFELSEGSSNTLILEINQNYVAGERNGYNNFADLSQSVVIDNEYNITVDGGQSGDEYKAWLIDANGTTILLGTGFVGGSNTITIPSQTITSGFYRLRIGIGQSPVSGGGFTGELRDFLLVANNTQNSITCGIPSASPPITMTAGSPFTKVQLSRQINQDDPVNYRDFAEWATIIAAKYGTSYAADAAKDYFGDRLFDNNPTFSQGDINYIEIGNEQDKFWRGDISLLGSGLNMYQMIPSQYAAYLSASYDGNCQSSDFEMTPGEYLGVKNFAPDIKVANGGLAGFQGVTLEKTIDFCVNDLGRSHATNCSGSYLPFDVINFHHYCTTTNAIPENSPLDGEYGSNNELPPNSSGIDIQNRFEYFYENPNDIGLNGGTGASPEEGGLKTYIELTLERLMTYIDNNLELNHDGLLDEFTKKEVWLSEFGYDSANGSPVSVKDIPGDGSMLQQTQADWLVRSFLEISAAEAVYGTHIMKVNRAMAFDYRDTDDPSPLYQRSGLLNADYAPKKSWYHVQTLRNVLGGTEFKKDLNENGTFSFVNAASTDPKPRIYQYHGSYYDNEHGVTNNDVDILAIWSPTSDDSEEELTLDLKTLVESSSSIETITLITPRDGDENGYHVPITDIANSTYTFTGKHAITETPMYVVLNVAEEETEHTACPDFVIEDQGCSSFTLRWAYMQGEPKKVDIYVVNANNAVLDNNGKAILRIENEAYKLQARDYKYDIRKHGIGHLKAGESYYVIFLMKWADGSIHECSTEKITMPEDGLCQIPYWDGNGTAPSGLHFTASIGSVADDGLDAFTYLGMDCANYEETVVPDCNAGDNDDDGIDDCHQAFVYDDDGNVQNDFDGDGIMDSHDADYDGDGVLDPGKIDDDGNGIDDRYERKNNKIWEWPGDGVNNPQMIIEFSSGIILNSLSFLHTTGNGYITVEYELCGCPASEEFGTPGPDKGWYHDVTFAPNGWMNWVYLSEGFPANSAISRIRLTRYQGSEMSLARLSFCGEARACPTVHEPPGDADPDKGFRRVGITTSEDGTSAKFRMAPIPNLPNDPSAGYKPVYHMLYQEDNGQELDFTSAKYQKAILYEGSEEVTATIKDLLPEKQYKVYVYLSNPCNWRWGSRYPIIPNLEGGPTIPLVGVLDTIIYFNTYKEGEATGNSNNDSNPKKHFVSASPNPTTGWTTFNWDLTGYSRLLIYSSNTGELVASYQVDATGVSHLVDLTGLGNGSYYIRLEGDNLSPLTGQFVKTTE